jgi:hypothetical protein
MSSQAGGTRICTRLQSFKFPKGKKSKRRYFMRINSAYYRQEGSLNTSLLLQQVYDTKKEKGIMLGCVCTKTPDAEGGAVPLCDRLLATFRQNILTGNTDDMEKCCAYIKSALVKPPGGSLSYSGMFLNGDEILLFGYGGQRIYLLNSAFMRPHLEILSGNLKSNIKSDIKSNITNFKSNTDSDEIFFNIYKIEAGAAVIAATEPFYGHMDEERLKECLYVNNDNTGVRAGKHIKEYGRYLEEAGGHDMGAVIVKLVEE